jgi:hypothetical protein
MDMSQTSTAVTAIGGNRYPGNLSTLKGFSTRYGSYLIDKREVAPVDLGEIISVGGVIEVVEAPWEEGMLSSR